MSEASASSAPSSSALSSAVKPTAPTRHEEEEEEELATLAFTTAGTPHAARAERANAVGGTSAGPQPLPDDEDAFDLGIAFVPAKKRTKTLGTGSSASSSAAATTGLRTKARGVEELGVVDGVKKGSGGIAMDRDASAIALPDDTDYPKDEKEYTLWRERLAALSDRLSKA